MFLYIQQSVTYFETFLSFVIDEDKYLCTASIFASAEEVINICKFTTVEKHLFSVFLNILLAIYQLIYTR